MALVSSTGPQMGKARILLGGKRVASVDLSSETTKRRTLVWARNFERRRRGTISVVATSGRVVFGGIVVLR